jgi:predicted PurR-regulated permease PerM
VATAYVLWPYLPGLLGAAVLFVLAAPLHRRLRALVPPRVAAVVVTMLVLVLLLVPGSWLVSTAVSEASDAVVAFQRGGALQRLAGARVAGFDVGAQMANAGSALVSWASAQAVSLLGSATTAMLNLAIALLGLYYLLSAGDVLWARVRGAMRVADHVAETLRRRFLEATEAMVLGTFLAAVVQATIVGFAFVVVGLRGAVLAAVVTACVSVLPVVGSAFVWLPASAYLALDHRYAAAAAMFAIGAVLASNLDNVVWLIVYRRVSGIHPMVTLLGALGGVRVFGMIGLLVGPLALSYLLELAHVYEEMVRAAAPPPRTRHRAVRRPSKAPPLPRPRHVAIPA